MEEKYPIKFSLSQFILLLAVEILVMGLVFLLGARFGKSIFPENAPSYAMQQPVYQDLAPPVAMRQPKPPASDKLVDSEGAETPEGAEEGAGAIPTYEVGADGSTRPAEDPEDSQIAVNKSVVTTNADKNTAVRFKSSGNTKFAVHVAEFYDELLASREISKLKAKGYEAYLVIDQRGSTPSFDVRVGSFGDRKMAEDFATKMSNAQNLELRVVQAD
ncbi:MAG TPA: SPOR domain-containing protein [bacterium]|nr:SPOR domain-containing protein [bacterium]